MGLIKTIIFLLNIAHIFSSTLTPGTFLEVDDKNRFKGLFQLKPPYLESNLQSLYYSVIGSAILHNDVLTAAISTNDKVELCKFAKDVVLRANSLDSAYFGSGMTTALNCPISPSSKLTTFLESYLKEGSSIMELFRASSTLVNLKKPLDSAKVSKILLSALKKDESLLNMGVAFQLASNFKGPENMSPFVEKIGDIIVQADEVDGKNLQFEGGLGVTANIVKGIFYLATAANKPTGLSRDQVLKFSNYFLSRKSVQTVKGAAELVEMLKILTNNKYHIPVCIVLYGPTAITPKSPIITVQVTDVLGKSLSTSLSVRGESTAWKDEKKGQFTGVTGDSTMFALDLMKLKPEPGAYNVTISATASKPDSRWVGNSAGLVKVIVMTEVKVVNAEVKIGDRDQAASAMVSTKLEQSKTLSNVLETDHQQRVSLVFSLKDATTGKFIKAHQVFVEFVHQYTKQEIIFVAEADKPTGEIVYKFDLTLANRAKDFDHTSGLYAMSLIVGDAVISNSFHWKISLINLNFPAPPETEKGEKAPWMVINRAPKPEIKHMFNKPDKRPPVTVSDTFSVLVLLPLLILLILWLKIGVNLRNIPFSFSTIVFHAGLVSIFSLFVCFWLKLDMFTTLKYLLGIGVVTFLSGHSLLSELALKRQQK